MIKLYNSLTKRIEEQVPRKSGEIGMYSCGPTVYNTATIANFRTYMLSDFLARSLRYLGYHTTSVMNLTDVGHLTGDNEGDANQGEDRLEKASRREGKNAWEIADFYGREFLEHMKLFNIVRPDVICKATEHITEQIAMISELSEKGFTYKIKDGIYFDTKAYEKMGYKYGELSNLDELKKGARLEPNPEKRDVRDFALWKISPDGSGPRRQMEWDSPWGVGFPGWHIECSAMSVKYLGEQFDIHLGGEDLRSTHHPNEIAQAEGASGKTPFVTTWVHGAFILVDGGRMGKSLGNAYTAQDLIERGYDPLALRYFYLTGHYRHQINFTWSALDGAASALQKLRNIYQSAKEESDRNTLSNEKLGKIDDYQNQFAKALENDLNLPEALSVTWEVAKSNIPSRDKADILHEFDVVLGLGLDKKNSQPLPTEINELVSKRDQYRQVKNWAEADKVRATIEALGWKVEDWNGTTKITKAT